jgi:hypothetical protein
LHQGKQKEDGLAPRIAMETLLVRLGRLQPDTAIYEMG